ncbi:hypothetical protein MRX96_014643 [Rhipicephalus microplus]
MARICAMRRKLISLHFLRVEGMVTQVVVRGGHDDSTQGSRASPDGTQTAGKKDTSTPEVFHEKEQAEVKPQIAEEGT